MPSALRRPLVAVLLLLLLPAAALAQPTDRVMQIGTNLAGPSDYGGEWPFVDVMRYARPWITQNNVWVDGGENPWDTGVLAQIPQDEDGYPLELPYDVPGTEAPQMVLTVWANTWSMPAGTYVLLYDGEGRLDVRFDGRVVRSEPGRLEIEMTPNDGIMALQLFASTRGNHVRNVRLLMPGHEATYREQPLEPNWVERLAPFRTVRFMDWGFTNNSTLENWDDRARVDDYTYTRVGMPYEWMAYVANELDKDLWVNIPHRATPDYVRRMAAFFRDTVEPEHTIYVEYSNEVWNWMFEQTRYVDARGDQQVPWPERIVPSIQEALDVWTDVFAGQEDRLVRVVGVQASWLDVSRRIVLNLRPGSFDAVSPAAYIGLVGADLAAFDAATTADEVLAAGRRAMEDEWGYQQQQAALAAEAGVRLVYYEGGQHFTPDPFGSDQPYNPALVAAQTHPGMYDLYRDWLARLDELPEAELFANFSFVGQTSGKYGSWGALENQFVPGPWRETAPKYQALLDHQAAVLSTGAAVPTGGLRLTPAAPNPWRSRTAFTLTVPTAAPVRVALYDVLGREVRRLHDGPLAPGSPRAFTLRADGLPSGLYVVRASGPDGTATRSTVLLR